jgi:hypothetical protein
MECKRRKGSGEGKVGDEEGTAMGSGSQPHFLASLRL